jgi:hypothetical protein
MGATAIHVMLAMPLPFMTALFPLGSDLDRLGNRGQRHSESAGDDGQARLDIFDLAGLG